MDRNVQLRKKKNKVKVTEESREKILKFEDMMNFNLRKSSGEEAQRSQFEFSIQRDSLFIKTFAEQSEDEESGARAQSLNRGLKRKLKYLETDKQVEFNKRFQLTGADVKKSDDFKEKAQSHESSKSQKSTQNVGNRQKSISARTQKRIDELWEKLERQVEKSADLETKLSNEEKLSRRRLARIKVLEVDLKLAKAKLQVCQEELDNLKDIFPALQAKIEKLKKELALKTVQHEILQNQLDAANSDLESALINVNHKKKLASNLNRAEQQKANLKRRLQICLEKEEELSRRISKLEEFRQKGKQNVRQTEEEKSSLKIEQQSKYISQLQQQIQSLEQKLGAANENLLIEQRKVKEAQMCLMEKEKEISEVKYHREIAINEAKMSQQKKIKTLHKDKQNLIKKVTKMEENKCGKSEEKEKEKNKNGKTKTRKGSTSDQSCLRASESEIINCERCNKKLRKVELKEHLRIHKGEEPNCCKSCNIKFSSKAAYKKHMGKHFN